MANTATLPTIVVEVHRARAVVLLVLAAWMLAAGAGASELRPQVEVEEEVYRYESANNGAGPMWCHGSTCLVRVGNQVFASGLETIPGAKPTNNCLPMLFCRNSDGWAQVYKDSGRTREPSPMVRFSNGQVLLSINPTLTEPDTYGGPARPQILQFESENPRAAPQVLTPTWDGDPKFTEHSYRSFAADGNRNELVLFQNIGYTHAEWSFRDGNGNWAAAGKLAWPLGEEYDKPQPIRVCYPNVAIRDRAVYFCGVSDIVEPYKAWKKYKHELTGRKWDYDFRRLFFTWCPDITTGKFSEWVEVASRDKTCGRIAPCDLHVAENGDVLLLWTEQALDERLREKFFPDAKQRFALMCGIVRNGEVVSRTTLLEGGEGLGGLRPGYGRFHVTESGRLVVFYYVCGKDASGDLIAEHRLVEISPDGSLGQPVLVRLETPLSLFFTATVRAGCQPSNVLDIFGNSGGSMRYARIRLEE